jgi:hypothetical protein
MAAGEKGLIREITDFILYQILPTTRGILETFSVIFNDFPVNLV